MNLQTLDLDREDLPDDLGDLHAEPLGFWKRQFVETPTRQQIIFDWAYGVIIPLVCIAADPVVFKGIGLLGEYRPFTYLLSAVSILGMAAWLLWGKRLGWIAAPIAGLFLAASLVSTTVGIILFPFSVFGLIVVIGALGFTPLLSGLVFLRNALRAAHAAQESSEHRIVWQGVTLGLLFSLIAPYVANVEIAQIVDRVVKGDSQTIRRESAKLVYLWPLIDRSQIAERYWRLRQNAPDSAEIRQLKSTYYDLTGEAIPYSTE